MIHSIHLQNFKCFEDQLFEFAPLTLLSGLNGMGKSTLLQSLLLLRQSYHQGLLEDTGLALNGDLIHLGTGHDTLFEDAKEEVIGFEIKLDDGTKGKWIVNYSPDAEILNFSVHAINEKLYNSSLFNSNFHYLQAERIGPRRFFEISETKVGENRQLGKGGEFTAHFLSKFGHENINFKELAYKDSNKIQLLNQVEYWLDEISPGTRLSITPYSGMDLVNLEYSFSLGKKVSNKFRSTNVGFGITYVLPIITAILSSIDETLLLIENPEAHLHPHGQIIVGELIALAANCGIQIIVETHSDHILNGIRVAINDGKTNHKNVKLYFFEERNMADGQVKIINPKIDENGRIDDWPKGFFDEWDNSLESLMKPKSK